MKKLLIALLSLTLIIALTACGKSAPTTQGPTPLSETSLVVGVTGGPHEEIMEKVKELATKEGLNIDVKVFSDYVIPNIALAEGELDINSFQHKPYLDNFKGERNLDLVEIAKTVIFPMGIYSDKLTDISQLTEGSKVALPNDPTNGARALILFESANLIKLAEGVGVQATVQDIVENPLNLKFIELEASQLPRQLSEVSAAAINANFAIEHGFVPTENSIFLESGEAPWVNVIAVRTENKDDAVLNKFISIYQSEEIRQFIVDRFQGSIIPGW